MNAKLIPSLLAFGLLAASLPGAEFNIKVDRLSPRTAVFSGGPWGNAIVAVATQKGIVVIDAPFSKTIAGGFREAIAAELKRNDFACLINTHEHTCHVSGNSAYADVPIVGHESIRADMLKSMTDPAHKFSTASRLGLADRQLNGVRAQLEKSNPEVLKAPGWANYEKAWKLIIADWSGAHVTVLPTITFDHRATLTFGDVTVRLDYLGCSHGVGDTFVSIPEENLVITAGFFYANLVPEITSRPRPHRGDGGELAGGVPGSARAHRRAHPVPCQPRSHADEPGADSAVRVLPRGRVDRGAAGQGDR